MFIHQASGHGVALSAVDPLSLILDRLKRRLLLVDVGARWGPLLGWNNLGAHADVICFEADPIEVQRLSETAPPHVRHVCAALGASDRSELSLKVSSLTTLRWIASRPSAKFCCRPERWTPLWPKRWVSERSTR